MNMFLSLLGLDIRDPVGPRTSGSFACPLSQGTRHCSYVLKLQNDRAHGHHLFSGC
jgi:hypothetical protein